MSFYKKRVDTMQVPLHYTKAITETLFFVRDNVQDASND